MKHNLTVILGSSCDLFYEIDSYPAEGDFTHGKEALKSAGGPPLNVGCVAASKGVSVNALDCLSSKEESTEIILDALKTHGVNTDHVFFSDACSNGKVLILNRKEKRTMIVIDPVRPKYEESKELQDFLNQSDYLYSLMHMVERSFDGYTMIEEARKHGAKMIFDGTSHYEDPKRAELLLKMADGLFINTTDYQRLKECLRKEPYEELLKNGCEFICVTDSVRGAICYTQEAVHHAEALKLEEVVDSTGAGDAFAGAFLSGRMQGRSYAECLKLGCISGAYACMHYGGLGGCCSMEELIEFARLHGYDPGE